MEEWITEDILKAMKYRDCLKSRLDSNKNRGINDLYLKQQYNRCRNITTSLIRKTKKELIYEKIRLCRGKSKDIWKVLTDLVPTKVNSKNKTIPEQELTAQQFNDYFISEPTNIIDNNLEINSDLETPITHNTEINNSSTYSIPIVTSDSASKLINGFSVKKAVGSDGLSIKVIKLFKFAILPILVLIMNLSINKCIFPTLWKIAKIKPLFKSGKSRF